MTETLMLEAYDYLMRERKAEKARFEKRRNGTNADKIRSMTDEALAEWLEDRFPLPINGLWLDWLKQEVEEGE